MVVGSHCQHEVCFTVLHILQGCLSRLQADNIGNTQLIADEFYQVDVIAHGLSLGIKEGIGPQIPGILIDQRMLSVEYPRAVIVLCV